MRAEREKSALLHQGRHQPGRRDGEKGAREPRGQRRLRPRAHDKVVLATAQEERPRASDGKENGDGERSPPQTPPRHEEERRREGNAASDERERKGCLEVGSS